MSRSDRAITSLLLLVAACGSSRRAEPHPSPEIAAVRAPLDAAPAPDGLPANEEIEERIRNLNGSQQSTEWMVNNIDRAGPYLLAYLEDPQSGYTSLIVMLVLGEAGVPEAVPLIARRLQGDDLNLKLTFAAAGALARHPAPEAAEALSKATESSEYNVVWPAVSMLGERTVDDLGRPALERALNHALQEIRYVAVQSLMKTGAARSQAALAARLDLEQDAEVADLIKKALRGEKLPEPEEGNEWEME